MSFSLMVSTADQRVAWVSDSFVDYVGLPSRRLVGRSIFELLDGAEKEKWAQVFDLTGLGDEEFDRFPVRLIGDDTSGNQWEVRHLRYVDSGRHVMISLRLVPQAAEAFMFDPEDRTMSVGGRPLDLPAKEFDLLAFLAARPGQVFTRAELLDSVWNSKPEWQVLGTVTEHIHRLRAKIEKDPNRPKFLRTVRGKGYSFGRTDSHDGMVEPLARSSTHRA